MEHWYQAIPWVISLLALGYTIRRNHATDSHSESKRRREWEQQLEDRTTQLEVEQRIDRAQHTADLQVINARIGSINSTTNHSKQLLKTLLSHVTN